MDVALFRDVKNRDGIPTYLLAFSKRSVNGEKVAERLKNEGGLGQVPDPNFLLCSSIAPFTMSVIISLHFIK